MEQLTTDLNTVYLNTKKNAKCSSFQLAYAECRHYFYRIQRKYCIVHSIDKSRSSQETKIFPGNTALFTLHASSIFTGNESIISIYILAKTDIKREPNLFICLKNTIQNVINILYRFTNVMKEQHIFRRLVRPQL